MCVWLRGLLECAGFLKTERINLATGERECRLNSDSALSRQNTAGAAGV